MSERKINMDQTNTAPVTNRQDAPETPPKEHSKIVQFLLYIVDGFIMGLGNVIPGVSGGTLALILGIYEKLIDSLSNLFKKFGRAMFLILPLLIGVVIAFLAGSRVIIVCLDRYLFPTIMLFFGAVIGGLPMLFQKTKEKKTSASDIVTCVITFAITIGLLFLFQHQGSADVSTITFGKAILWVILGAVAAATMVIPGISGSAFLMTVGYYKPVMACVSALTIAGTDKGHAVGVLLIWAVGIILGIVFISKLIRLLLNKYEARTYWGIIGFVIGSAILIILQNFFMVNMAWTSIGTVLAGTSAIQYILGVVLAVLGFYGAYKLGDK